jgi:membrane peptidoglycan carboxypeptidase
MVLTLWLSQSNLEKHKSWQIVQGGSTITQQLARNKIFLKIIVNLLFKKNSRIHKSTRIRKITKKMKYYYLIFQ